VTKIIGIVGALGALSLVVAPAASGAMRAPVTLYVATDGNDTWSGRQPKRGEGQSGPFATLERAREEARRLRHGGTLPIGAITIEVSGGTYELKAPFTLTAADSGAPDAPTTYRAQEGEEVRLSGGRRIRETAPVSDALVLARLDEAARGHVVAADLRALGITDYGEVKGGGLEVFFGDRPMTLARWPNTGFAKIADVVGGQPVEVRGTVGDAVGAFVYEGDRPERWVSESDPWLHGYWFWDWADEREPIESLDPDRKVIRLRPPYHTYGYRKGQWYYAFNMLSELDAPGEWYLDRGTGVLYFWPPSPLTPEQRLTVSVTPTLIVTRNVSNVVFDGFILEAARDTAVTIMDSTRVVVRDCLIRNVGGDAVVIAGGKDSGVTGCEIHDTGRGGVLLSGGNRDTLRPAGLHAEDNHIHHYSRWARMYHPAIALDGVGNRAVHNLIHDAPHQAIAFSGNDHMIDSNEIHHVCLEANDAGAIYSGRDWTWRGTVIQYNWFHDIRGLQDNGCMGVYLDDMLCGTVVYGNVFYRVSNAVFIGGGRDNLVENNVFVSCDPAVHIDARALGWAAYHVNTTMMERLREVPYREPPWSERYPDLVGILENEPAAPRGNVVTRNVFRGGRWVDVEEAAKYEVRFEANLLDADPRFVNAAHLDFRLRRDSPALTLGFKPLPTSRPGPRRGRGLTSSR
jgi:hypothetical protein